MLVVTRFSVPEPDGAGFAAQAREALAALAARPGYVRGRVGRAVDDPTAWLLTTEWDGVGSYRRALGAYEVKVQASPLLARAQDEPSAYETVVADDAGSAGVRVSDRAADADRVGVGEASGPAVPRA